MSVARTAKHRQAPCSEAEVKSLQCLLKIRMLLHAPFSVIIREIFYMLMAPRLLVYYCMKCGRPLQGPWKESVEKLLRGTNLRWLSSGPDLGGACCRLPKTLSRHCRSEKKLQSHYKMTVTAEVEGNAFLSANTAQAGNPVSIQPSLRHMRLMIPSPMMNQCISSTFLDSGTKINSYLEQQLTHLKGVLLGSAKQAGMGMRSQSC